LLAMFYRGNDAFTLRDQRVAPTHPIRLNMKDMLTEMEMNSEKFS